MFCACWDAGAECSSPGAYLQCHWEGGTLQHLQLRWEDINSGGLSSRKSQAIHQGKKQNHRPPGQSKSKIRFLGWLQFPSPESSALSTTGSFPSGLEDWKGELSYLGYSISVMYVGINCPHTREVTSKIPKKVNSQRK